MEGEEFHASLGDIVRFFYLKTKAKQKHANMLLEQVNISSPNNKFLMKEVMLIDSEICI